MRIVLFLCLMLAPACGYALGTTSGNGTGTSTSIQLPQLQTTVVGSLPSCSTALRGAMYVVTDSLLPAALAQVAGGGAVVVGVICNGTIWIVL